MFFNYTFYYCKWLNYFLFEGIWYNWQYIYLSNNVEFLEDVVQNEMSLVIENWKQEF